MGRNSSPKRSATGLPPLALKQPTSSQARLGRMDAAKASMPGSAPLGRFARQIACRAMDELRDGELFYALKAAQTLIEHWRIHYNTVRPHSVMGYRSPAPESIVIRISGRRCTNNHTGPPDGRTPTADPASPIAPAGAPLSVAWFGSDPAR